MYVGKANGGIDALLVDPINPNVAYAGTRGRGVLKTVDGGATWNQFNAGLSNTVVYGLAIDPSNGSNIFAATDGPGAFRSTNAGATWNSVTIGKRGAYIRSLATDPSNASVVYAGSMNVFKSTNAGASWTTYAAPTASTVVNQLVVDSSNENIVYALMHDYVHSQYTDEDIGGSVFKSSDGGVTWSTTGNGLGDTYINELAIDPSNHNVVYAISYKGLFKSTDGGGSWSIVPGSVPWAFNLLIAPSDPKVMYVSAYTGDYTSSVFESIDGGENWGIIGSNLSDDVRLFAVDPNNAHVVYVNAGGNGFYKSADGGDHWSEVNLPANARAYVDPNNSNTLYAIGDSSTFRSTDGGVTWNAFADGLHGLGIRALATDRSGTYLHAATDAGVFDIQISPSVQPPNKIDDTQFFVHQQYLDFLNREPDASGYAFWTNEIASCGSDAQCIDTKRVNVSAAFFLSIEFQQTGYLVYRMYHAAYGNLPNAPVPIKFSEFQLDTQKIGQGVIVGQTGWETLLENNKQAFSNEFANRTRFTSAYPQSMSPAEFVDKLNANAGNPLSQTERDHLVSDLETGAKTRAAVLRAVAENEQLTKQEFNRAFVLMQYFGYLRRNPNDAPDSNFDGYDFWLNKLNAFNGDFVQAEMVKAFITADEYRRRFGP